MKYRNALIIVILVILADQAVKFFVKTHFINGDEVTMAGHWAKLHFIENEGMAYGLKLGFLGETGGKILLTLFRLVAVIFGFFLLKRICRERYEKVLILCGALILAGALGNLLDSLFYGLIFTDSPASCFAGYYDSFKAMASGHDANMVAHLTPFGKGYGKFMQGRVVDMFYFPIVEIRRMPDAIPFLGGKQFVFFEPVFNVADAAISVGVMILLARLYVVGDKAKLKAAPNT